MKNEGMRKKMAKSHSKKVSVDLRGFDLFYDSDEDDDEDEEVEEEFKPRPPMDFDDEHKTTISKTAQKSFKRAQKKLVGEDEDEDLKGFHLFDEYNSDDEDDDVVKLHELDKDQLTSLVRSLFVENAILKDAASRARAKLDSRKQRINELEQSKRVLASHVAEEMNNMHNIIAQLVKAVPQPRS